MDEKAMEAEHIILVAALLGLVTGLINAAPPVLRRLVMRHIFKRDPGDILKLVVRDTYGRAIEIPRKSLDDTNLNEITEKLSQAHTSDVKNKEAKRYEIAV